MKRIIFNNNGTEVILDQKTVEHIVHNWYLDGMYPDLLHDEDGRDLEEILDVDYSVAISRYTKKKQTKTQKSLDHLESEGFYVGNLWQVSDVQDRFECTDEEALEILDNALTNQYMMEQIHCSIREHEKYDNLKIK